MEADIEQEKEVNVQKLVAYYQKLVNEVHKRKCKCMNNLKTNKAIGSELDAIKQTLAEHASQLKRENFDFIIKTLDGEEEKWKAIQTECATLLEKVRLLEGELKKRIIGDQKIEFKPSTNITQIENICGNLDQGTDDSTILSNKKMKKDLVTLCKLSGKQFKLLYRATRDGFQAASFHARCDNKPATLTIIRTTKGYIFGGYTSSAWDSTGIYKADPNAFLFSLLNVRSAPQLMPVQVGGTKSIYCNASYGPTFGSGHDMHISSNSNTSALSYSNPNSSYVFASPSNASYPAESFLAGSYHFISHDLKNWKK